MALRDSKTGLVTKTYSVAELCDAARLMRGYNLVALCAAGSGHAGSTLSVMDLAAALYLSVAEHDPRNPEWPDRDRILWSAGHKAPALYVALGMAGFCPLDDVVTLRKLGSPFQGHPHWLRLPGVEISTGSLGQGLSIAVGMALAARINGRKNKILCLMGDGEQQEGQVWEAAMEAGHFHLDNIIAVIDCNRLQIDGLVKDVMQIEPLAAKYSAFGWDVLRIDGHNMSQVVDALEQARAATGRPIVILADTIKGKGVSFMEGQPGWHGKAPNRDELEKALNELGLAGRIPVEDLLAKAKSWQTRATRTLESKMPRFSRDFWWNADPAAMQVTMEPTRKGFGRALAECGSDERVVCLGLDISGSITIADFYAGKPERARRWISMGIAEQSATAAAAGLAREGKLPVLGSYATFSAARNLDQLRVSVCYSNLNVLVAGAHAGVSVGPDGATHQALEDLFAMLGLPNMAVVVPCDAIETRKATHHLLLDHVGPKYIRFAREATPIVTDE
jgi:transketolase